MKSRFIKLTALMMLLALALLSLAGCAGLGETYELALGTVYTEGKASGLAAAVLLDAEGKIVLCRIDEFNLDEKAGTLTSKKDLGDDYGMSKAGAVEWDEQVAYLERLVIGKTRDEVLALATKEGAADLTAGCTIYAGGLIAAIDAAIQSENRTEVTAAGEITIALTLAADKATDTAYTSVACAVAMYRGYKLASLYEIDTIGK